MDKEAKKVRMTSAQVISVVPKIEEPIMKVYTIDDLRNLVDLYQELQDPWVGEFIIDIQIVHWDEEPKGVGD